MEPHQQRVVDEKKELDEKKHKLAVFFGSTIFAGLDKVDRDLLELQHSTMEQYSQILQMRIERF